MELTKVSNSASHWNIIIFKTCSVFLVCSTKSRITSLVQTILRIFRDRSIDFVSLLLLFCFFSYIFAYNTAKVTTYKYKRYFRSLEIDHRLWESQVLISFLPFLLIILPLFWLLSMHMHLTVRVRKFFFA